jgi:hypothetical protein
LPRRFGAVRLPAVYGNDDSEDEESVIYPGAVRIPGPREELYNDDVSIAIGTINGDDQSYNTNRNASSASRRIPLPDTTSLPVAATVLPSNDDDAVQNVTEQLLNRFEEQVDNEVQNRRAMIPRAHPMEPEPVP